jgi:hypothetical protein
VPGGGDGFKIDGSGFAPGGIIGGTPSAGGGAVGVRTRGGGGSGGAVLGRCDADPGTGGGMVGARGGAGGTPGSVPARPDDGGEVCDAGRSGFGNEGSGGSVLPGGLPGGVVID